MSRDKPTDEEKAVMLSNIQKMFDDMEDTCVPSQDDTAFPRASFSWSAKGIGFGSFTFYTNSKGELCCDNECMGRDFIKKVFCKMVDDCKLDHPEPKGKE